MLMTVLRPAMRYGGKSYLRGESLEVRPQHVRVLKLLKKAAETPAAAVVAEAPEPDAPPAPAPGESAPDASDSEANEPASNPAPDAPGPAPYRTRRLKAKD